ncbi:unnamed protein product [Ascophyllum nodosum]
MSDPQERLLIPETTDHFLWIVIVGAFGAFFAAFGIGANDVANAFATSVGAKAVTLKQAIILAGIAEFLGAVLLGNHVTKAVRESIVDVFCFVDNPGMLMYGMMCIVYSTGAWLLLASYLELPVSTTHSTVGSIIGMAIAYGGPDCVVWQKRTDIFPYLRGVSAIVVSWVVSPLASAILSCALFYTVRSLVLRSPNAYERSFYVYPLLVLGTVAVNVFFFLYKGASSLDLDDTDIARALKWALGLGGGLALITIPTVLPYIKRKVATSFNEDGTRRRKEATPGDGDPHESRSTGLGSFINRKLDHDVHALGQESEYVNEIHAKAEKFDPRAEEVFKYVQVLTAICDAFGHGANDVANAMGPFEMLYIVYVNGGVENVDNGLGTAGHLILALGGLGIVLGLALYGYKIIAAIGVKIAKITPSRGFSIELGAAVMIIIGTRLEFPLSTTHCQVGATAGVALLEGIGGINSIVLVRTAAGWLITIVVCGLSCALLFAQGAYAPFVYDTIDLDSTQRS